MQILGNEKDTMSMIDKVMEDLKQLNLPIILGRTVQQEFPKFMRQRFEVEIARKLQKYG